jgi:molecular chaperone HscB
VNLTPSIGICIACEKPAWPVCRRCTLPVPLPPSADHFAVLQISRRLHLDLAVLGDQMVRFTQFLAPRRFAAAGPEAQHVAGLTAKAVKDAYTTLRDPVARATYWLARLDDAPVGPPDSVPGDVATLLADRAANGAGIDDEIQKRLTNLRRLFLSHDEAEESARAIHLSDIRREAGLVVLLRGA